MKNFFKKPKFSHGFTLVEIVVATGLFAVVMLVGVTAVASVIDANRKAQTQQIVLNNLSAAVENMSRNIRTGTSYACSSSGPALSSPQNCSEGDDQLTFKPKGAIAGTDPSTLRYVYRRATDAAGGYVEVSKDNGGSYQRITSPEINVKGLKFYVRGACPKTGGSCTNDNLQPYVLITVFGTAKISERATSDFNIQTTVTQRLFDI